MQRGIAQLGLAIILIVVVLAAGVGVLVWRNQILPSAAVPVQKDCPMFARLCPDGSSVAPTGPDCQVPACPSANPIASVSADLSNWKTYNNSKYGFSFKYPSEFNAQEANQSFIAYFQGSANYPYSMLINFFGTKGDSFNGYLTNPYKQRGKTYQDIKITIDGKQALQHEINETADFPQVETFIDNTPSGIVQILVMGHKNNITESLLELNNQILSTFKFSN